MESELAERWGITRAGVRAALLDLTSEGLVERIPNRGARVRTVSVAEAVQITECRMVLEGLRAARAAERATDGQLLHLGELGEQLRASVAAGEPLKHSALNHEIRSYIRDPAAAEAAARAHLSGVITALRLAAT